MCDSMVICLSGPFGHSHWAPDSCRHCNCTTHYGDVIMGMIVSKITGLTIVYSTVYSDADQRKHQSSESLAFVWEIHRGLVNSPHKWPVTRKMFPFDDVIMCWTNSLHLKFYGTVFFRRCAASWALACRRIPISQPKFCRCVILQLVDRFAPSQVPWNSLGMQFSSCLHLLTKGIGGGLVKWVDLFQL